MFDQLQQLLSHRDPRLVCVAAGDSETAQPELIAHIDHEVTAGLDPNSLAELRNQVGGLPHLVAFYEKFGSARLFRDSVFRQGIGRASAYYIAPPDTWGELRERAGHWFSQLDDDEAQEILPDWMTDYVVVGEIPNSGNYFLVPLVGEDRGKVYEFEHDGYEFIERGRNFEAFVDSLAQVAAEHLERIGGHTRYCDAVTSRQWMPRIYMREP